MNKEENPVNKLIRQLESVYNDQYKVLTDKLEQEFPKPLAIKEQPKKSDYVITKLGEYSNATLGGSTADWWKTYSYWDRTRDIDNLDELDKRKEKIKELANQYIKDCQSIYEQNLPVLENNKAIVEKVKNIMRGLGVKDTYSHSYFKTNRSSQRTIETKTAGYISDLERTFKTNQPSVPSLTDVLGHYFDGSQSTYEKLKREITQKAYEAEQERKKREQEHGIALLRAKYTPEDAMSEASDILEGILEKCKYLRLAHLLQKNRGDWSDGYSYAECGINGFEVQTSEDQEIYNEIQGIIDDGNSSGDIDGRMFRDCEYNYDFLFGKVDQALMNDYSKVKEYIGYE